MTKLEKAALGAVFGANLKKIRGDDPQRVMAEYLGVGSQVTYLRYEKGRLPRRSILFGIASKFGITERDLLEPLNEGQVGKIRGHMAMEQLLQPTQFPSAGHPLGNRRRLDTNREPQPVVTEEELQAAVLRNPAGAFHRVISDLPTHTARSVGSFFKDLAPAVEDAAVGEVCRVVALEIYGEIMRRDNAMLDEIRRSIDSGKKV